MAVNDNHLLGGAQPYIIRDNFLTLKEGIRVAQPYIIREGNQEKKRREKTLTKQTKKQQPINDVWNKLFPTNSYKTYWTNLKR